jgi:hypothetical protein
MLLGLLLVLLVTLVAPSARSSSTTILMTAVYHDTYLSGEPDEAFRLMNASSSAENLAGWTVTDGEGTVTLAGILEAGQSVWVTREAASFAQEFGFAPDYEYGADTDPAVPNLILSGDFRLADDGDEVILYGDTAAEVDCIVYEDGDPGACDWLGAPVEPYGGATARTTGLAPAGPDGPACFGLEGQILYRKLDQASGLPVPDTGTAADWAQDPGDPIDGTKVQYPGWDLERYFYTRTFTETATVTYAVAPDNIYEAVLAEINQATTSIFIEGYTFRNAHLADAIVARMAANPLMKVKVLLEGEPVGGIEDQQKWICQQIEEAGGEVWFMYNDDAAEVHDRYNYQHGNWMIIDEEVLLTGSENLNRSAMPADDKSDGTEGNRGVWLITDAPSAVAHAVDVFLHDLDIDNHRDLFRWTEGNPNYGAPPPGFEPDYESGGTIYPAPFPTPLTTSGEVAFEIVQSPENSLRDSDSLLGMVARAGISDTVLVEQMYEYPYWGASDSNPADDPNPRLEAYIESARRGASVRILLDSYYDEPTDVRSNLATCAYVNDIAGAEDLDLQCKRANPTGTGIHNKMVLVDAGGHGYVHTGSIGGSEASSKSNRELAVQVRSDAAHSYLSGLFWHDWGEEHAAYLPLVVRGYAPPAPPESWQGEVTNAFQNCGLTRLFGYTLDPDGDLQGDVWVHYWADGWDGAWAKSLWYDFGEGTPWTGDDGNWDGVLDNRARDGTWHVCVVAGEGSWDCLSNRVDVTTSSDCVNGYQVYHITFRQD